MARSIEALVETGNGGLHGGDLRFDQREATRQVFGERRHESCQRGPREEDEPSHPPPSPKLVPRDEVGIGWRWRGWRDFSEGRLVHGLGR